MPFRMEDCFLMPSRMEDCFFVPSRMEDRARFFMPSCFPSCVPGRSEKESVSVKCCLPCMPSWSTKRGRSKFLIPSCTRLTTHATVLVFSHSGAPTRAGGARQPSLEGTILLAQTALPAELRRLQHIEGGGGDVRFSLLEFRRGSPEGRPSPCSRPMVLQRLQHIDGGGGENRSSLLKIQRGWPGYRPSSCPRPMAHSPCGASPSIRPSHVGVQRG